jgi:formiminotetrahydrofolate cyclodeaminase
MPAQTKPLRGRLSEDETLSRVDQWFMKKESDQEAREQELQRRRKTAAPMPAAEAMTRKELVPCRQLGHADAATTLRTYAHLFEKARHAAELREGLGERFGHLLARSG